MTASIDLDTVFDAVKHRKPLLILGVEYVPAPAPKLDLDMLVAAEIADWASKAQVGCSAAGVADRVLDMVANWLEMQPRATRIVKGVDRATGLDQREHDVRLLRGMS